MPRMTQEEIRKWSRDKARKAGDKVEADNKETGSRCLNRVKKEITKL